MDWRKVKTIYLDGEVYDLSIVQEGDKAMWEIGAVVCGKNGRMRIQSYHNKVISETGYGSRAKVIKMWKIYPQRKV